ncbi:hypothetical protein HDV01_007850 [Terramyces sp. JEL0728]|nr:hypothetical protein HDV01_007850 [Terramyces sp. JEL0728]
MADLNYHPSMTYQLPPQTELGVPNYVSFKPVQATTFNPNDTIQIKLSSNNELFNFERSYWKYTITPSVTGSTNGNYLNPMGSSAIVSSIQEQIAGTMLPVYNNYNIKNSVRLFTASQERQSIQSATESFIANTTGTLQVATSTSYISPIPSGTDWNQAMIPLCAFNGGMSYFITLAPANQVFTTGTYTVSNVELVAHLVTPPQSFLEDLDNGLRDGHQLQIPVNLYKSIPMPLTSATTQDLILNTNYLQSLNSICCITHDSTSGFFNNSNIVQDWYINCNGQRWPRNKLITAGIETIYQQLASQNTVYSSLNNSVQPFQYFSWKACGDFNTGISTNNGVLDVAFDYTGGPSGATSYFIFNYDAILSVSLVGVNLNVGPF